MATRNRSARWSGDGGVEQINVSATLAAVPTR